VHDAIGFVLCKRGIDDGTVFQVAVDEFRFGVDRGAMTLLKVVENDDFIASPYQFMDDGAADIPSPACDKYFHDFTFLLEIWLELYLIEVSQTGFKTG
jgi:hypothetical protein